jgi:AcrR family transcriptional regulator
MMKSKKKVGLDDVASNAGVSRATVYRYFPSINLLFLEASLDILHKSPEELNEETAHLPISKRIAYVQEYYNMLAENHELAFRRYLASALSESVHSRKKLRGARRVQAFDQVLTNAGQTLSTKDTTHLKNIATILSGIDVWITCKDVCGLKKEEAENTLKWGMEKILSALDLH